MTIKSVYNVLHLLKFKAINYVFSLPKLNSGCTYTLMPFSASSITPSSIKNGPDCGYIVVLPKIEIMNDTHDRIREIGSYCIPISFVQTSENMAAEEGRLIGKPRTGMLRHNSGLGRSKSKNVNGRGVREDSRSDIRFRRTRETHMYTADNQMSDKQEQNRNFHISVPSGDGEVMGGSGPNYTPTSFKHLRSIEDYVTPDHVLQAVKSHEKHVSQNKVVYHRESGFRNDDFSFDVYENSSENYSPLDHIEKQVVDDSFLRKGQPLNRSELLGSKQRPSHVHYDREGDNKATKNELNRKYKAANYMPPFKQSEVLNKMYESPLTSPRITTNEQANSNEKKYARRNNGLSRQLDRHNTFGDRDYPRSGMEISKKGSSPGNSRSDNAYPGSLLNTHSSKK
jgi:hypothetical protein